MPPSRISGWIVALAFLLMVGCGQDMGNSPSASTDPTSTPGAAANGLTTEETTTGRPIDRRQAQVPPPRVPEKQAGLFFPQMPGPEGVILEALGSGRLFVENDCIYLGPTERRYRGEVPSDVVVWPHGYSLSRKGGEIRILNEEGRIVARVGERVSMGGGEIRREDSGPTPEAARRQFVEKRGELGVPDQCGGPLWLSSGVITKPEK